MKSDYEKGSDLHGKWRQLPEIVGKFDLVGCKFSEKIWAVVGNFPKFHKSVSQALEDNLIEVEDIAEVVIQLHEDFDRVMGENQFFKNEMNQFFHVRFQINIAYREELDRDEGGTLSAETYDYGRPLIRFLPSTDAAQKFSQEILGEVEELPRGYFV